MWLRRASYVMIGVGVVVAAFAVLSPRERLDRNEISSTLATARFEREEVPQGFSFLGAGESSEGVVYARFEGPDDINRIIFWVFDSPAAAERSLRSFDDGPVLEGRRVLGPAHGIEHPSICIDFRSFIECWARVGQVLVAGESRNIDPSVGGDLDSAMALLRAGIAKVEAVL